MFFFWISIIILISYTYTWTLVHVVVHYACFKSKELKWMHKKVVFFNCILFYLQKYYIKTNNNVLLNVISCFIK